jgi:hypothetical protein
MPFDWLKSDVPASVLAQGAAKFKAQQQDEVRGRAALLRRLGYPRAFAETRCLHNQTWAFEAVGRAPLSGADIKALVAEAYRGA